MAIIVFPKDKLVAKDPRSIVQSNLPSWSIGPMGPTTFDFQSESSYGSNKVSLTSSTSWVSIEPLDRSRSHDRTVISLRNHRVIHSRCCRVAPKARTSQAIARGQCCHADARLESATKSQIVFLLPHESHACA